MGKINYAGTFHTIQRGPSGLHRQIKRILAIDITREGFEWALRNSCLSHFEQEETYQSKKEWLNTKEKSPVRIQWDPERDIQLNKLDYRSIQIGLSGDAIKLYVNDWIVEISDITSFVKKIDSMVSADLSIESIIAELPVELPYPIPSDIARTINSSHSSSIVTAQDTRDWTLPGTLFEALNYFCI